MELVELRRRHRVMSARRPPRVGSRRPKELAVIPQTRASSRPVILDVDTGVDDMLALLVASSSPAIELTAVTCVAGNTSLANALTNTRTILGYCREAHVPVAAGAARALLSTAARREPAQGDRTSGHGDAGRGYAEVSEDLPPTTPIHAAQLIAEEARRRPGQVTLVSTGPMTNVALALQLEPELPHLLDRWILMGGAYSVAGNATPRAESNVQADPEAAQVALTTFADARVPPLAVGLDVTQQVRLQPRHIEQLAALAGETWTVQADAGRWGSARSPLLSYVEGALRKYAEYHQRWHGFYGVYLHDPITVVVAIDATLVATKAVAVEVECRGTWTRGQTVADWKDTWRRAPNVDVAVEIDAQRAMRAVITGVTAKIGADTATG